MSDEEEWLQLLDYEDGQFGNRGEKNEKKNQKLSEGKVDFEDAVALTGYGKFHYLLLLTCGWANAADAVEILATSFLLPTAQCDLKLTSEDKGWLSAVLFIGMLVGGFIWGSLSDTFGRKRILILAMLVNALCAFISSFCRYKEAFLTVRFFSGVGVGGSIPVVWTYFAEFQPKDRRGNMLSFLAAFWMVGNIAVAGLAWIIFSVQFDDGGFHSWRIFTMVCGMPALLVAIGLTFLPESPKFLVVKGRQSLALNVLKTMYAWNKGRNGTDYPVTEIIGAEKARNPSQNRRIKHVIISIVKNTSECFKGKMLKPMLLMLYINFAIQFGYYGLWMWFPDLFNRLTQYYNEYPDDEKTVCQIIDFKPVNDTSTEEDPFCSEPPPDTEVFVNSFLLAIAALPGNIWTVLQMDKLGRKLFLVLSMFLSGICAFFIYLISDSTANLLVSMAFGLVSTMGFNSLDCLAIELFPTSVRSTAMAITLVAARIGAILGNVLFGYLVDTNCAIPILSVAVLLISGGVVGIFLPNTTRVALS